MKTLAQATITPTDSIAAARVLLTEAESASVVPTKRADHILARRDGRIHHHRDQHQ